MCRGVQSSDESRLGRNPTFQIAIRHSLSLPFRTKKCSRPADLPTLPFVYKFGSAVVSLSQFSLSRVPCPLSLVPLIWLGSSLALPFGNFGLEP